MIVGTTVAIRGKFSYKQVVYNHWTGLLDSGFFFFFGQLVVVIATLNVKYYLVRPVHLRIVSVQLA